jgi:8-oxo-dGTP pyrophosphatase MutT (NUDIX family)
MLVLWQGKVLTLLRGETAPWRPLKWDLPGGQVDRNESTFDAAIREAWEEAGVEVNNVRFAGMYPHEGFDLYAYRGDAVDGNVVIRPNSEGIIEHEDWAWVDAATYNDYHYAIPTICELIKGVLGVG